MKCTIPEISWHNREPILSVDIHPICEKFYRLATGGGDCHLVIWQLNLCENGAVKVEALAELTRHQKAVNSVRWSPTGQYLASADDDANIIIWQLKTDNIPLLEGETGDKETWIVTKILRGHKEDIYDLSWSPNGLKLLSGSIDNTAILWDFTKGKNDHIMSDHKGFVQGVCWDPKGHYMATISTDRICRIFDSSGKQVKARIQKGFLPVPENHYLHNKEVKYFHDDTFKSFFRRLHFSPDGSLLVTPSGHVETEDCKKILNATYIFAVDNWTGPVAILPSRNQCSTVVRFCPILFELQDHGPDATISLPYRMIVAVGAERDVILYDTQQMSPFAYFRDIHYTRLTDLTWSSDGLLLVASSTDGFCALITFEPDELGIPYVEAEQEESVLNISGCEELEDKEENKLEKDPVSTPKPKKPSLLDKWTIKTPKSICDASKTEEKSMREPEVVTKSSVTRKRIVPTLVVEKEAVPAESVPTKKATPIAVRRKPKEPEVSAEKTKPNKQTSNSGTLLKFLTPSKKSSESSNSKKPASVQPEIILDEIEARDAWLKEKENKAATEAIEISDEDDDECSQVFSLHLDETCSQAANTELKSSENGIKPMVNTEPPPQPIVDPVKDEPQIVVAKRRVPLITLSSPKRKKNDK